MPLSGIPRLRGIVRQGEELVPVVPGKPDGLKPMPSNPGLSHRPAWAGQGAGATRGKKDEDKISVFVYTQQPYAVLGSAPSGGMVRTQQPYAVLGSAPSGGMVRTQQPYAVIEGDL